MSFFLNFNKNFNFFNKKIFSFRMNFIWVERLHCLFIFCFLLNSHFLLVLSGRDFYSILRVKRDAEPDEIKSSFKKLALKLHPDKNQDGKNYFIVNLFYSYF